jgi:hypothetical protein
MRRPVIWTAALLAAIAVGGRSAEDADPPTGTLTLSPDLIEIKTIYSGAELRIEGEAQTGSEVVVVIRGPDKEENFNKKVRAGPIWISSGEVHVSGVPALFLSFSPRPVRAMLPEETVERYVLDPDSIKHHMLLDAGGDPIDEDLMAENYLTLKGDNDIYQVHDDSESLVGGSDGRFALDLHWPQTAQPAPYVISAYECRDGKVVRESRGELDLAKTGIPERISSFANEEAAKYGALAVIIAMCAGFGIDFLAARLFGAKPAAH